MPTVAVLNMQGKEVGKQELSEAVFGIEPNVSVMNDMVKNYLANQRQGTQSALTRSEVSGGGRKPWRQKGTGRARQGSTRAPQWTHGGIVFAPKPRSYRYTLNKKVRRLAMKSALSSKLQDNELIVIDQIASEEYKTKAIAAMLKAVGSERTVSYTHLDVYKRQGPHAGIHSWRDSWKSSLRPNGPGISDRPR